MTKNNIESQADKAVSLTGGAARRLMEGHGAVHVLIEGTAHVDCKKVRFFIFIRATLDKTWAPGARIPCSVHGELLGSAGDSVRFESTVFFAAMSAARGPCFASSTLFWYERECSLSQVFGRSCLRGESLFATSPLRKAFHSVLIFSRGSFTHFVRCCFRPWCVLTSEGNLCKCHLVARVAQSHSCNNQSSLSRARLRDDPTGRVQPEGRPGRAVDGSRLTALWVQKETEWGHVTRPVGVGAFTCAGGGGQTRRPSGQGDATTHWRIRGT